MEEDSMKKGLLLTLVMVAIALSGYRAMGRAPVVDAIQDIIVGDGADATASNEFVYPDYINLNDIVRDDGPDSDIVWSFFEPSGKFIINGVPSLDSVDLDQDPEGVIQPPENRKIAGLGVTAIDVDGDSDGENITITIRNQDLSPIGGPNVAVDPDTTGPLDLQSATITLFASDGGTIGMTIDDELPQFIAYTGNDMDDQTSTTDQGIPVKSWTFDDSTSKGWNTKVNATAPTFLIGTNGLCLEVGAAGENGGEFQSPYGADPYCISLVANSVWRVRMTVTSIADEKSIPMWMFCMDNSSNTNPNQGGATYGAEFGIWDTDYGENSTGIERSLFEFWINPTAVMTDSWNNSPNGPFAPGWDSYNDMRLRFRVFDYPSKVTGASLDQGQVCLQKVEVARYSISDMIRGDVVFEDTDINLANWTMKDPDASADATAVNEPGGGVRISPAAGKKWTLGTVQLVPGDGSIAGETMETIQDDYPIALEDDTLYLLEAEMSCPSMTPDGIGFPENQGDVIRLGLNVVDWEFGNMNQMQKNFNCAGTPKAEKDTFMALYYSHTASWRTTAWPQYARLRPRFDILSHVGVGPATGSTDPTVYHSMRVTKVRFY
jgi:hypothetical protein